MFSPPAKEEALSLNLYIQQVSGTLALMSCSKIFPAFCAIFHSPLYRQSATSSKEIAPLITYNYHDMFDKIIDNP